MGRVEDMRRMREARLGASQPTAPEVKPSATAAPLSSPSRKKGRPKGEGRKMCGVRLSDAERAMCLEAAEDAGLTFSEWARRRLLR